MCFQKWSYSSSRLCATSFTIVGTKSDTAVSSQEKDEIMIFTALRDRTKTTSVGLTEQESMPDREGISVHSLILGATQRTWLFWARFLLRLSVSTMGQPVFQLPQLYESESISSPISIPRGTTTHAGGKLLVTTRDAPNKVRGEAYCISMELLRISSHQAPLDQFN
jgi:hypothetical protein